jgi:hypothetical protein
MEPTRLTRLVRGELDWIVMKALEKDRSRRYETASGLAQDVQSAPSVLVRIGGIASSAATHHTNGQQFTAAHELEHYLLLEFEEIHVDRPFTVWLQRVGRFAF